MTSLTDVGRMQKGAKANARKRIWQLDSAVHCSVIGTCLSVAELKQLCRRLDLQIQAQVSDYDLHHAFVSIAAQTNYSARLLQKYLDAKYRLAIRRYGALPSRAEWMAQWQQDKGEGELAGAFWALSTQAGVDQEVLDHLYGEVHMHSHEGVIQALRQQQEVQRLQRENATLQERLQSLAHRSRREQDSLQGKNAGLRASLQDTKQELWQLQQRLSEAEPSRLHQNLDAMRGQLEAYAARFTAERMQWERVKKEAAKWKQLALAHGDRHVALEADLAEARAEREAMENTLRQVFGKLEHPCDLSDATEVSLDLCVQCILYVGGRDRQCARFRAMVETQNGRFLHHDGGLHGGNARLSTVLPQADVVLCPVDCISHDAGLRAKQFCKRNGKRMIMLPRASLAAFSRALQELVAPVATQYADG